MRPETYPLSFPQQAIFLDALLSGDDAGIAHPHAGADHDGRARGDVDAAARAEHRVGGEVERRAWGDVEQRLGRTAAEHAEQATSRGDSRPRP